MRNFLASLKGTPGLGSSGQAQGKLYPMLNDLLDRSVTISMLDAADDQYVEGLLSFLPSALIMKRATMSSAQKRTLLKKTLRSPQFAQSLASLSVALRDGGLPSVSEALRIEVENGGLVKGGAVPLGGGEAIEAFVNGVKKQVQKKRAT